jgi:pimeloyl-ACP methyl ester carboxylesterase
LDYFQRVIPQLTSGHRVYALDFPGMGWSDIVPGASYNQKDLQAAVVEFVDALDLTDVTLVGESIGAAIALSSSVPLAARIRRVVASNPYDYPRGIERANLLAGLIVPSVRAPLIGPLFAAVNDKWILRGIMRGGVADPQRLPDAFLDELVRVGSRAGYPRVARAIFRNLPTMIAARSVYPQITVPVDIVYGTQDWSRERDRARNADTIPHAALHTWNHTGHFAAIESPKRFAALVLAG